MAESLAKTIVHMVGTENGAELMLFGADVRTLCGKVGSPTSGEPTRYVLTDSGGHAFQATTRIRFISCQKCNRSLDKYHAAHLGPSAGMACCRRRWSRALPCRSSTSARRSPRNNPGRVGCGWRIITSPPPARRSPLAHGDE